MNNWDLIIVVPLIIILGLAFLYFLYKKQNFEKKIFWFYTQTLIVWVTNAILIQENSNVLTDAFDKMPSATVVVLLLFGSSMLFAILLKPFATWITGKIRSRNIWIRASILASILASLLLFIPSNDAAWFKVIIILQAIILGISISSQSLYFLYLNEQKYNRLFALKVSFAIGFVITFATFIGNWILNINNFVTDKIIVLNIVTVILLLLSLLISFKNGSENKNKIGEFRLVLKEELIKYSKSTLVKLIILTLILGIIYGFIQSPIFRMYFVANSKIGNDNQKWLEALDRKYQALFIFGQFVIGYTLYKIMLPKIGVKNLIFALIVISGLTLLISTFVINSVWIIISNLIFGSAYFVLFYMWFAFAIMWNYRASKGIPVTGFIASALLLGQFLVIFIFNSFIYTKTGLFTYQSIQSIIAETNIENIIAFENNLKKVIRITAASLFFINSIYLFLTVLWIDQVIAEFIDYANIKHIFSEYEKQSVEKKINSRIIIE
ncbi:hypothetical protein MENTO_v1c06010 [Mesoplasma entomophilum]|uniref:MFS transporter n=1 Tax=Mesoplasma entomophilum TaxID=2149 RepID=A0A3S5XZR5_9MOLU|nr:MFS cation transporter [Mesoplasma entomophilum]ATQ35733.1 hypothetical protein CS528_03150 [Mesoplasma entomophilum]ATZ19702.1 hypothetical protein MENTO_v1c06010 [Mesoplasma entomophilum]